MLTVCLPAIIVLSVNCFARSSRLTDVFTKFSLLMSGFLYCCLCSALNANVSTSVQLWLVDLPALLTRERVPIEQLHGTHRLLGEQRWGINKDTVLQRMFAAYANPDLAQSEQRMPYSDAIRVLCSLGCGNRVKQAEALFTVCDEDGGGLVTRAELLKFIAGSLPDDTVQHKTETFSKVSI